MVGVFHSLWCLYNKVIEREIRMKIQVAGPGCARCQQTEKVVVNAAAELGLDADISHIYDVKEFATLGVRITPAILIDGKIVMAGRVPSINEAKHILQPAQE
jgi:small redox-active disulfide protein 2